MKTLFDLPYELLLKILSKTSFKEHGRFARTSMLGKTLADDHSQWNFMLKEQFRSAEPEVAKHTFINCPEKRLDEFLDVDEAGKVVKATREKVNELSSLTPWKLADIGQQYTQDFQIILSNPVLYNKLNNVQISNIVRNRVEAIKIVFATDELCDMLNGEIIRNFAHSSFEIAKIILTTPKLYNKLSGANIYNIAISRLEITNLILDNSELYEKVSEEHLQHIKKLVEIASYNTIALKF